MIFSIGEEGLIIDNFIAIDRFTNPDVKYCFLSSAHSHLCRKLTNKRQSDGIYCSPITAKLLPLIIQRYRIFDKWIRPLELNIWHEMDEFRVMFIDANHAPGAVMLIIDGEHRSTLGRILYTGFFRADARFYQNMTGLSALQEKKFDVICIDSTYANFVGEEFPNRRSSAKEAANLLRMLKFNGADSVAIPVPAIGYESFLINISRELKCKIWLHPERFEIARILGIKDYFSDTKEDTYIWTCSQIESQQVLSTTDSHIIKASMAPCVMPNISLNTEREHMIRYSDHCSSAELRSFLSLLSFSRVIGIPSELPLLMEKKLQNLSLFGTKTMYYCKAELDSLEEFLFDPFEFSWKIGLAFDYTFRKFCHQLSTDENLPSDENAEKMLPEASRTNNCISEQHLEMGSSGTDQLVDMPHAWNPNSRTYSFQKFFSSFVSDILDGGERDDTEGIEDKLDEMMMFDVEYAEDDSQIMENSSQVACENTESSIYDTKMVIGIIEEQYDVSILLDYLTSIFYTKDSDYDSTEDTELLEFLYDMDISKIFNDFDMFEKYQERNMGAMSIEIMNQLYHVEENICYDPSNAPILPDVVHELLDDNPFLKLHEDDLTSPT